MTCSSRAVFLLICVVCVSTTKAGFIHQDTTSGSRKMLFTQAGGGEALINMGRHLLQGASDSAPGTNSPSKSSDTSAQTPYDPQCKSWCNCATGCSDNHAADCPKWQALNCLVAPAPAPS